MDIEVQDKVKKILALSYGTDFVGEAEAALLKAQTMLKGIGLTVEEFERHTETEQSLAALDEIYDTTSGKRSNLYLSLMAVISSNFRCMEYSIRNKHTKEVQARLIGNKEDIELCLMVYKAAVKSMEHLADRYLHNLRVNSSPLLSNSPSKLKKSFMWGFSSGLNQKFEEQKAANSWELVLATPKNVTDKAIELRLVSAQKSQARLSGEAHESGSEAGRDWSHADANNARGKALES